MRFDRKLRIATLFISLLPAASALTATAVSFPDSDQGFILREASRTVLPSANCSPISPPEAAAPAEVISGTTYRLSWPAVAGVSQYDVYESQTTDFSNAPKQTVTTTSVLFVHGLPGSSPAPYYYRVWAVSDCDGSRAAIGNPVRVVVSAPAPLSVPPPGGLKLTVPVDQLTTLHTSFLLLPPEGVSSTTFSLESDVDFITISPSSGTVTSEGAVINVTVSPFGLPVGTNFGTILVSYGAAAKGTSPMGNTPSTVPVGVSLVTPVSPVPKTQSPPDNALIIPAVAHADGIGASFVSDVRISNNSSQTIQYQVAYTPSRSDGTKVGSKTTFSIGPGVTTALDDVVRQWFGSGALSDGTKGMLEIRPLNFSGKTGSDAISLATIATSRTYAQTPEGTFGQFIPGIPYSRFIGKSSDSANPRILGLQQIAQSAQFRTNIGLLEAGGQPATVEISIFDSAGANLGTFTETLLAGEHKQMDQYLASKGLSVEDGRMEVKVLSDTGHVTTYASVIDNVTVDPQFVPATDLAEINASRYIVPGLAELKNSLADWRSDMRIFNASSIPETATLTYYPQGAPDAPVTEELTIEPGETKVLNDVVQSLFGMTDSTGGVLVDTQQSSSLVVTARTYDQREVGTFGQFISAKTLDQTTGLGESALQTLQIEESERFRTNFGIAEVTGNPVKVQLVAIIPTARQAPTVTIELAPYEFRQINGLLKLLNVSNAYNVRVSAKVIEGAGRITTYASVVDNETQDPTFVPGQ